MPVLTTFIFIKQFYCYAVFSLHYIIKAKQNGGKYSTPQLKIQPNRQIKSQMLIKTIQTNCDSELSIPHIKMTASKEKICYYFLLVYDIKAKSNIFSCKRTSSKRRTI